MKKPAEQTGTFNHSVRGEQGIALVMVLILSSVMLVMMAGLIYLLSAGTQVSGVEKRYRTAQEAGKGGSDVFYQYLAARGDPGIAGIFFTQSTGVTNACLTAKLNQSTTAVKWAACTDYASASSLNINPLVAATYDWTVQLGGAPFPTYTVYSKIVNTVEGNSGGDLGLTKSGVVSSTGEVAVVSIPYIYTIEINAENAANSAERAKYSILYQY